MGLPVIYDGIRQESDEAALKIGNFILEAYRYLRYQPIILPVIGIEERLEIILKNIADR
jgi:predicted ATPase